ncbi:MAG: hypothetical protein QXF04_02000 [Candidatus Aenigmatarchaeota archaeon]
MSPGSQGFATIVSDIVLIIVVIFVLGVFRLAIKKLLDSLVATGRLAYSVRNVVLTIVNLFVVASILVVSTFIVVKEYWVIVAAVITGFVVVGFVMFFNIIRSYIIGVAIRATLKPTPHVIYLPQYGLKVEATSLHMHPQYVEIHDVHGNTYLIRNEHFFNAILVPSSVCIPVEVSVEYECVELDKCYLFIEKTVSSLENYTFTGTKREKKVQVGEISRTRTKLLVKLNPVSYPVRSLDLVKISREISEVVSNVAKESSLNVVLKDVVVSIPLTGIERFK